MAHTLHPEIARFCVENNLFFGFDEGIHRYNVQYASMLKPTSPFFDQTFHDKYPSFVQDARTQLISILAGIEASSDTERYFARICPVPVCINENDRPRRTITLPDRPWCTTTLSHWLIHVDELLLDPASKIIMYNIPRVLTLAVFHDKTEAEIVLRRLYSIVHKIAAYPLQALSYALRGVDPPTHATYKSFEIDKLKVPGYMWEWFVLVYRQLPAIIAEKFCMENGHFRYADGKTFNPDIMTCPACCSRLKSPPRPFTYTQKKNNRPQYTKNAILGAKNFYLDLTTHCTQDEPVAFVGVQCDSQAMLCLAAQVRFAQVLEQETELDKEYCMGFWPGCYHGNQTTIVTNEK
jgi:hypothetical protein